MTRLPATTAGRDDGMRRSLGVSSGLHIAVFLFLYFGLPTFLKPLPEPYVPVPLEIVDIADITNTRVKPEDKPKEPPAPQPKPELKPIQQQQPPQPPAPPKPPEPPKPQETKPEQVEAMLPVPKPAEKPKPPPEAAKPQTDMLASVLKNVEKMKAAEQVKNPDTKSQTKDQTAQPQSQAPTLSTRLTISEEDALRRQIEGCWSPPIGARDAKNLAVDVTIAVNPDRTVQTAEVVDKSRMVGDPYFRAAAEAAIRAVYNPRCSPLELPEGKYEQWKTISFTFDPRDML